MNTKTIIAIALAIGAGIVANLTTPFFRRFPTFFLSFYTKRQITNLEKELSVVTFWRANQTDLYLYLLHVALWILAHLLFLAIVSLFVVIVPLLKWAFLLFPAVMVFALVRLSKTMSLITAVRQFEEYKGKTESRLALLKKRVSAG